MTVIATDGKTIAADSLTVMGNNERHPRSSLKIRVRDHVIYAFAGDSGIKDALMDWYASGHLPNDAPKGDWSFMVITAPMTGKTCHNGSPYFVDMGFPFTFGSGGDFALGAMRHPTHPATPAQAVEVAIALSTSCGGPVTVVDIAEVTQRLQLVEAAE